MQGLKSKTTVSKAWNGVIHFLILILTKQYRQDCPMYVCRRLGRSTSGGGAISNPSRYTPFDAGMTLSDDANVTPVTLEY